MKQRKEIVASIAEIKKLCDRGMDTFSVFQYLVNSSEKGRFTFLSDGKNFYAREERQLSCFKHITRESILEMPLIDFLFNMAFEGREGKSLIRVCNATRHEFEKDATVKDFLMTDPTRLMKNRNYAMKSHQILKNRMETIGLLDLETYPMFQILKK